MFHCLTKVEKIKKSRVMFKILLNSSDTTNKKERSWFIFIVKNCHFK